MNLTVAPEHPALPGHFPGYPIVPGVVMLDLVLAEVTRTWPECRVVGVRKWRFQRVWLPNEPARVEFGEVREGRLRVSCLTGDIPLCSGVLQLDTPDGV
jgi:3-hydroxyacyl-[acyl-carrier-protein] dehydratase